MLYPHNVVPLFGNEKNKMSKTIRRNVLVAFLAMSTVSALGQNPKGGFSIRPMAGVSVSTFMGGTEDGLYKSLTNMTGGLEVEYAATNWLGLSLGASYLRMGAKMDGDIRKEFTDGTGQYGIIAMVDGDVHGDYLSFPLLSNVYIPQVPGLAVKLGVQVSALVKDRMDAFIQGVIYNLGPLPSGYILAPGEFKEKTVSMTTWRSDVLKSVDFGIPIGLSYEYKNIVLDARYCFGLKKIDNTDDAESVRNRCLTVTLGYRLHL